MQSSAFLHVHKIRRVALQNANETWFLSVYLSHNIISNCIKKFHCIMASVYKFLPAISLSTLLLSSPCPSCFPLLALLLCTDYIHVCSCQKFSCLHVTLSSVCLSCVGGKYPLVYSLTPEAIPWRYNITIHWPLQLKLSHSSKAHHQLGLNHWHCSLICRVNLTIAVSAGLCSWLHNIKQSE